MQLKYSNPLRKTSRYARQSHGLGGTPEYHIWYSMIDRCGNPDSKSWKHYGARGITVCERWLDVRNFVADMGLRPNGCSLDRIDGSKGYEPGNCRWATELQQQRNRRSVKCSERLADQIRQRSAAGESMTAIARSIGMHQSSVSRIANGKTWRPE